MDKVWFKLRQTEYPPPTEESMGTSEETAPLCLGHFIADLKHIDFPLNRDAIAEFPASMPVFHTTAIHFHWHDSQRSRTGGSLGGGAPIPAAAGAVTVNASVELAFARTLRNHEEYERMDSYIVQPNKAYVAECLEQDELAEFTAGRLAWSMFMITGLRVARKGKRSVEESSHREGNGGPEVSLPTVASATATLNVGRDKSQTMKGTYTSDFVWAVRLAKVSKGFLMTDWSLGPYSKRATFFAGKEEVDVAGTVAAEGLSNFLVVEDKDLDEAFVIEGEQG